MNSMRGLAILVVVATMSLGPLAPWVAAQQPAAEPAQPLPPTSQPLPPSSVPPPPPQVVVVVPEPAPPQPVRRTDLYDMGAAVATAAKVPGNLITCAVGGIAGGVLFIITLGSAYKATTRVIEEGCAQRWIIRGEDLRPRGAPGLFDRSDSYGQGRQ